MSIVALAGRPNTGKTSLFNALTGRTQRIANFAGTTVEKAVGELTGVSGDAIEIVDLPGIITPLPTTEDQKVSLDFIDAQVRKNRAFAMFWVAEASNLDHDLAMALFFHRLGYPVVLVLNMMDEAEKNGLSIDLDALSKKTGLLVLATSVWTDKGLGILREAMMAEVKREHPMPRRVLDTVSPADIFSLQYETACAAREITRAVSASASTESVLATVRQAMAIDRWLLHPIAGPIFFAAMMLFLFNSIFSWAAPITDRLSGGMDWLGTWVTASVPWPALASLLADGVIAGLGAVIVFVPQIAILFLLIGVLEKSGYLPRAAALMDRLMRPFGLDGKVFVPLLSSFACAIPGIMATRTLESQKRRLSTILLAPLMTCSARLPVYTLLISAFVPVDWRIAGFSGQGMVMAAMYFLAVVLAMLVALVLKHTALYVRGGTPLMILPPFRVPRSKELLQFTWQRCAAFIKRAGKVIFVVSVILWFLAAYPKSDGSVGHDMPGAMATQTVAESADDDAAARQIEASYLGRLGKTIAPVFAPLGYDWKLSVAILSAFAAREVFVGTLGTIYALGSTDETSQSLVVHLQTALGRDGQPLYTLATAVSLLLFFAIALQCISTIAITYRETGGWKWPAIQATYLWVMAYAVAFLGYRLALWII